MSKKINIVTPGICRNILWSSFKKFLNRKAEEEYEYWDKVMRYNYLTYGYDDDYDDEMRKLREYYNDYPSDDDYYVEDDGTIVFPMTDSGKKGKHKHKKHRTRSKRKGVKVIDINTPYSGFEDNPDDMLGSTKIYFYPDYHEKYDRLEFDSLAEFDRYCTSEGYSVPRYVTESLVYKPVCHCCLNPRAMEYGTLEVMCEDSYGELVYAACDESELSAL